LLYTSLVLQKNQLLFSSQMNLFDIAITIVVVLLGCCVLFVLHKYTGPWFSNLSSQKRIKKPKKSSSLKQNMVDSNQNVNANYYFDNKNYDTKANCIKFEAECKANWQDWGSGFTKEQVTGKNGICETNYQNCLAGLD